MSLVATEVFDQILEHAKKNKTDALQIVPELKPGEFVPQGDINIWALDGIPENTKKVHTRAQLATGTTRGSRHCIKSLDLASVVQYEFNDPNPLQGPIFQLLRPITIEHPEHGDQLHSSKFIYISYQRKYAEELKRIED